MTKNCQARCSLFGICKQNRSCKEGQSFDPQPNPTQCRPGLWPGDPADLGCSTFWNTNAYTEYSVATVCGMTDWPVTRDSTQMKAGDQLWPKWPNGLVIYLWLLVAAALTSFFRFQPLDRTDGPQTATSSTTDRHQQCCRRSAVLLAHGTPNSKSAVYYHTAKILTYNKILTTTTISHTLQYYFVYKRSIQTRRRLVQVWHFVRTNDKNSIC